MVKKDSLSSDIDVIKEFEELKLKQKLLIESLRRNGDTQQNKLFLEINSKLDFLVKIFTEANSSDEEDKKIDYEAKFNEVLDKIDALGNRFDDNIKSLEDKIEQKLESVKEVDVKKQEEVLQKKDEDLKVDVDKVDDIKKDSVKSEEPPLPTFESKIETVELKDQVEKEKKKRKWF